MSTHVSQKDPVLMVDKAADFMFHARELVGQSNRHQEFILNMEQMPIQFSFQDKKTIDMGGKHYKHACEYN